MQQSGSLTLWKGTFCIRNLKSLGAGCCRLQIPIHHCPNFESRKVSTWSTGCHLWEGDAQNISHGLRLKTQRPSQERPSHPKNPSGWGSNPIFRDDLGQTSTNLNVKIPSWKAVTCSTEHPKHSNDIILIYRWIYTVSFAATLARNDPYHFSFTSTIIQHWITESRWLVTKKARSHIQN